MAVAHLVLATGWTLEYIESIEVGRFYDLFAAIRSARATLRMEELQTSDFPHLKKNDRVKIVERLKREASPGKRMSLEEFMTSRMRLDGDA